MKKYIPLFVILALGCKEPNHKSKIDTDNNNVRHPITPKNILTKPEGAVTANFRGDNIPLYGYVKDIDVENETTIIGFENNNLPQITIPESIGAKLKVLKLNNFDRDLLLVNAKLKDTSFNEYYLFYMNDSVWEQPINHFDIHKSNMTDTLVPIQINPKDSTKLMRYYSVFDMDRNSSKKFTWKLMRESVAIKK
jgi:hypothetical protein